MRHRVGQQRSGTWYGQGRTLRRLAVAVLLILTLLPWLGGCFWRGRPAPQVLIFSKTKGYRHASIDSGRAVLMALFTSRGLIVDTTEQSDAFHEANLSRYAAIVFLNTTGTVLNSAQKAAFERYIQAGGGFVGIHSASDTEYGWPWYSRLVGAQFSHHPNPDTATLSLADGYDKLGIDQAGVPNRWRHYDEWYSFKRPISIVGQGAVTPVLMLTRPDTARPRPIAWHHEYDGGRAFYTALGHTEAAYRQPEFLAHVWGGLRFAMGRHRLDYRLATTPLPPDPSRFSKVVLASNLDEPMELAIDHNNRCYVIHRKGLILAIDPDGSRYEVGRVPVWTAHEDGLMGIALDPNFRHNRWVYLYYSPLGDKPVQRLSRFSMQGGVLDLASESLILEVPVQRDECCHSGGSLAFDAQGLLYLSVGDNSNPFKSDGYAPLDIRAGREPFDAQRSAGNTADLRGKILRIRPDPKGGYSIPPGNLFAPGIPGTRPEIYVMGCRNPFRIGLDTSRGWIMWGDIGPDASKDSTYGPRGYDELNLARQAGNYGWPFFIGPNRAYQLRDTTFDISPGQRPNDPNAPINPSPSNTGLRRLPPARAPLLYYEYGWSDSFPDLGSGGRCAMSGPVYYAPKRAVNPSRLPDYYDGAWISYDWMRGWIMATWLDDRGQITRREMMISGQAFDRPMDLEIAANGTLYILEYGSGWFTQNVDARLVRVEYAQGNRPPVAKASADRTSGPLPLTVNLSAKGSYDPDQPKGLRYEWRVQSPSRADATTSEARVILTRPGRYHALLVVTDDKGVSSTDEVILEAGNSTPTVSIETLGSPSFLFQGQSFIYHTRVVDAEDTRIDPSRLTVTARVVAQGHDQTVAVQGHQTQTALAEHPGKAIIEANDCRNCHNLDRASAGPAYKAIAKRYAGKASATDPLALKVIRGGGGVWGEKAMSAHPSLRLDDARAMVGYILSLEQADRDKPLAPQGSVSISTLLGPLGPMDQVILSASYKDLGYQGLVPMTGHARLVLRHPKVEAEPGYQVWGASIDKLPDSENRYARLKYDSAHFHLGALSMRGVGSVTFRIASTHVGQTIELRHGATNGPVVARGAVPNTGGSFNFVDVTLPVRDPLQGRTELLYVRFNTPHPTPPGKNHMASLDYLIFHPGGSGSGPARARATL